MPQTVIEVDIEEDLKQVDIEIEKAVDTVRNDLRELVVNDHVRKVLVIIGEKCEGCCEMKP
jgi:hypothetical protein